MITWKASKKEATVCKQTMSNNENDDDKLVTNTDLIYNIGTKKEKAEQSRKNKTSIIS